MGSASVSTLSPVSTSKRLHVALWIAQGLLALAFGLAGGMKLAMSASQLASNPIPTGLVRFIGVAEVAGALGVLLPSASRVLPRLASLAAVGLFVVMVLAAAFHVSRGEWSHLPPAVILGGLAAFVAWGRFRASPIAPR